MSRWQKLAVALTASTLLYSGQIRMYTSSQNRFLEQWSLVDALSLVLGVLLFALLALGLDSLIQRSGSLLLKRILQHFFLVALGVGLVSSLLTYADYKSEILLLGLAAFVAVSWCRPQARIIPRAVNFALVLSPVVLILCGQLLSFPRWSSPQEQLPPVAVGKPEARPVYIFLFDEWSYVRSTHEGEFLPFFKNVRELSRESFVFTHALSMGPRTLVSVPRMLFQTDREMRIGRESVSWGNEPATAVRSVFQTAGEAGYQTYAVGFCLPYRRLLGEQVDYCSSQPVLRKPQGLADGTYYRALENFQFWLDPFSQRINRGMAQSVSLNSRVAYSRYWFDLNKRIEEETLQVIGHSPKNSLSFFHVPVPHGPFVFKPDGSYAGPFTGDRVAYEPEGYENHLKYLDVVIGRFMAKLRETGKFDDALIIITSDHAWRQDNIRAGKLVVADEVRRVPLIIKWPHQKQGYQVSDRYTMAELGPLLEAARRREGEESVLSLVKDR